ncbi:hypothetical protein SAMN04515624_1503 [Eubacterium maltosivorans]|nr:hypothetical protein [Eubacterium maltosivorans]WPK81989.1 hypothetical protein EUMA32_34480 [Eubacterium maltosivorans]SDP87725.1 hypothetical protein SAMN04515624_1503 [Eubacterium maltosivorans]
MAEFVLFIFTFYISMIGVMCDAVAATITVLFIALVSAACWPRR